MKHKKNERANKAIGDKKIGNARLYSNCFASAAMTISSLHGRGQILDTPHCLMKN